MLSVKTSLPSQGAAANRSPSSLHHHRGAMEVPLASPTPNVVEEDDQAMSDPTTSCGSCNSLVDSMSSGTTTTTTSSLQSNQSTGGLLKRTSMKSSYALTSLLSQPREVDGDSSSSSSNHENSALGARSLAAALMAEATAMKTMCSKEFGQSLQVAIAQGSPSRGEEPLNFHDNRNIRQALELPLRQARTLRDSRRRASTLMLEGRNSLPNASSTSPLPLSSWVGLPYASLRDERPFLYDHMHTHPLNEILAQTLNVPDLHQLHQGWDRKTESAREHQQRLFAPLLNRQGRKAFQEAYDSFVTSCCLPLLHATALRQGVFNSSQRQHHTVRNDPVLYRYQVFPTINVVYPNDLEACQPPTCDLNQGKSVGWLHFHVPLTSSQGTAALYCEHFPGREDWHPLRCTQVGLGYCWDGARCLSFVPLNTTKATRVSLDFRILLVRASTATTNRSMPSLSRSALMMMDDDTLCRPQHLQDALTRVSGFYKEATMDFVGASGSTHHNSNDEADEPDGRCGFPFA